MSGICIGTQLEAPWGYGVLEAGMTYHFLRSSSKTERVLLLLFVVREPKSVIYKSEKRPNRIVTPTPLPMLIGMERRAFEDGVKNGKIVKAERQSTMPPWLADLEGLNLNNLDGFRKKPVRSHSDRMEEKVEAIFPLTQKFDEVLDAQDPDRVINAHARTCIPKRNETPQSLLAYGYADAIDVDPYMPTCLTGLAGCGKSQIQRALVRLLSSKDYTLKLDGHKPLPLTAFTRIAVSGHKSISQILRPLCRPEVANGSARISEPQMPVECAQWRYLTGACLFSADEMQFLAQSRDATTLVTQVLLAFAEVRTPWLFGANYSLCWKLLSRPSEATQRLLSRPVVLVPDRPGSTCWANVLEAYERVVPGLFGFGFKERRFDLWNYTAGIKRELVSLLTHAYRLCRQSGAREVQWGDVDRAYGSVEYSKSRDDVSLLISHAAQGGALRQDLLCPFVDDASCESVEQYKAELRNARANNVVAAAIDASMTVAERKALNTVSSTSRNGDDKLQGKVVKLRRGGKPTVASLQEAGRRFKEDKKT